MDLQKEYKFLKGILYKTNKITWFRYLMKQYKEWIASLSEFKIALLMIFLFALGATTLFFLFYSYFYDSDFILIGVFFAILVLLLVIHPFIAEIILYREDDRSFLENLFESKQPKEEFVLLLNGVDLSSLEKSLNYKYKSDMLVYLLDQNRVTLEVQAMIKQKEIEEKEKLIKLDQERKEKENLLKIVRSFKEPANKINKQINKFDETINKLIKKK